MTPSSTKAHALLVWLYGTENHYSLCTRNLFKRSSLSAILSPELTVRGFADIAYPRESSQAEATTAALGTE